LFRRKRWTALGLLLLILLTTSLAAANLQRDTLWRVEQACLLDSATTGSAFPCLEVNLTGGVERGFAILRAPLRQSHIVAMPTIRVSGIEDMRLRAPDGPNYMSDAWNARHFVQAEVERPLAWNDLGLAVNSRMTRSQDQLHIHIDCVRHGIKSALMARLAQIPAAEWLPSGFLYQGQSYWARRLDTTDLSGANVFALADEIPAVRAHPDRTVLAVIGVTESPGRNGFLLLAGQSDPNRAARQSTSEHLLDHSCRPG
jgi:CDP-diacylglycerol pyrophosphatase